MTGTATKLPAGAVLLTGGATVAAADAVRAAQRARRGQGLPRSVAWDRLLVVLDPADPGHADEPADPLAHAGYMDTETAATVLGCSERQARRLAPQLGGFKSGGVWLLDTRAVREHAAGTTTMEDD